MTDGITPIRAVLAATPARWLSLARSLPADLLRQSPAPQEWSALECLQHLVDTEEWVFPLRVQALLAGRDFPSFDPDADGTRPSVETDVVALAEKLARYRQESLVALDRLSSSDLQRTARHSKLGSVRLAELLNEWAAHDLMHTVQAERALMQPFIRECGPWRSHFADHDLGLVSPADPHSAT